MWGHCVSLSVAMLAQVSYSFLKRISVSSGMPWFKGNFHWPLGLPYCMQAEAAEASRRLQREAEKAARQQREDEAAEEAWCQQVQEDAEEAWHHLRGQRAEEAAFRPSSSYTTPEMTNTGRRQSAVEWLQQLREDRLLWFARHGFVNHASSVSHGLTRPEVVATLG